MDNVIIKVADITDINKIVKETDIDKAILARWLEMINSKQLILVVAQRKDKYIGRVNLWLAQADEPEINKYFNGVPLINALQINSDRQGKGIGTMIMQFAHNYLKDHGYKSIGLGVEPDNFRAINL